MEEKRGGESEVHGIPRVSDSFSEFILKSLIYMYIYIEREKASGDLA